ncbi:MAG TPA: alpha-mannosidase, partial [Armatimonadota bacterium]
MDYRIIRKKLELLQQFATSATVPITDWQYRIADFPAVGSYQFDNDWTATTLPAHFPSGKTAFLRAQVHVPEDMPREDSYLAFSFDELEGLLSVNGVPYAGIDGNHQRVLLPPGDTLDLTLEFMSVPAIYAHPEVSARTGDLHGAALVTVNREIEALCYEARFAWEAAQVVTEPRRHALLEAAVEAALLAVDLTLPRPRLLAEVAQAREILREKLAAIHPDPEAGALFAVGHSHIDTAWLWPIRETVRKCARTFSTACRLMERYPDFYFNCSQPQHYQFTKAHYPELYQQIKHWVSTGRWETAGAMWVEADCNVAGGEALIRQMLYGIHFFQQEFGTRPRMLWLPDVFGYPSSLPEIMAGCGVRYFYTYKLHWQARNPFPDHLFRWRGLDGSEVLAHVVNHRGGYSNAPSPEHLVYGWQQYAQKAEYPEVLLPFGHGDGGGGVTEGQMEYLHLAQGQYPGLPALRTGTAEAYFDDVVAADPALPLWDGELYVETHRGTYTTQSEMKRANRQCELLLREAEIWGSLARATGASATFAASTLREAWDGLLLHQFHDILPGSSIGMVYPEALATLAQVQTQ